MTQISSTLQANFDGLLVQLRHIQEQPVTLGLSVANALMAALVLVTFWGAMSIAWRRLHNSLH